MMPPACLLWCWALTEKSALGPPTTPSHSVKTPVCPLVSVNERVQRCKNDSFVARRDGFLLWSLREWKGLKTLLPERTNSIQSGPSSRADEPDRRTDRSLLAAGAGAGALRTWVSGLALRCVPSSAFCPSCTGPPLESWKMSDEGVVESARNGGAPDFAPLLPSKNSHCSWPASILSQPRDGWGFVL
ncbi:hypothetical protein FALBO_6968 [Fusarium albosuccineum]|uniref:Secreted protein n=1 Tax=Fusarium albosuccineum TaxID=1237068 RepID=A0A8H4PJX1_9HYPO|nr:hypothetical protein FALBO_6968 [Fusarium albosuccineum]